MEIELYSRMQNPLDAIDRVGEMFAKSGMFGCDRVEQGKVLAMVCLAEKKSPVQITRDYDIVEGKLRKKALAALADFRAAGGKHRWLASGDEPADIEEHRQAVLQLTAPDGETITYRYSMADARAEGLIRPNSRWQKRPGNMLRARCISNGIGMLMPEIFAGEDGDGEPQAEPVKAIKLDAAPTVEAATDEPTKPEPKPVVVVVDVQASDQVIEAVAKVAPTPTPESKPELKQPEPPAFAKGPAYTSAGAALPDELVAQVEQAIGEHAVAAVNWMVKEGWLKQGQPLSQLSDARARRIIKQSASFIRAVAGGAQ